MVRLIFPGSPLVLDNAFVLDRDFGFWISLPEPENNVVFFTTASFPARDDATPSAFFFFFFVLGLFFLCNLAIIALNFNSKQNEQMLLDDWIES
jgi:hypothetical protein